MRIGLAIENPSLEEYIRAEASTSGIPVAAYAGLGEASADGCSLVFAEWFLSGDNTVLCRTLRERSRDEGPPAIVALVPSSSPDLVGALMEMGVDNVLLSPPDGAEIRAEIDALLLHRHDCRVDARTWQELRQSILVGETSAFRRCLDELQVAARSDGRVLLLGETGTGKEMFARALHHLGKRSAKPFLAVNCSALAPSLIESELFGHAKGAFTGALAARIGRFEAVGEGTLLLDEIGDLEVTLQMKLLRVIEHAAFERLGENILRPFKGRLIAATSVPLPAAMESGRFRRDLYERLNQHAIFLPPLRERRADILLLARTFLEKLAPHDSMHFNLAAEARLETADYPGNVRQLENAIEYSVEKCRPRRIITPRDLPEGLNRTESASQPTAPAERRAGPDNSAKFIPVDMSLPYAAARKAVQAALDELYLEDLYRRHGGVSAAAEAAGLDRKTFSRRWRGKKGPHCD